MKVDFKSKQKELLTTYNELIEIFKNNKKTDKAGYPISDLEKVFTCWGNVNNLYGKELYNAYNVGLENTFNVTVRYCNTLKELFLNSENKNRGFKLRWNNVIYDISLVDFLQFEKKQIVFKVRKHE